MHSPSPSSSAWRPQARRRPSRPPRPQFTLSSGPSCPGLTTGWHFVRLAQCPPVHRSDLIFLHRAPTPVFWTSGFPLSHGHGRKSGLSRGPVNRHAHVERPPRGSPEPRCVCGTRRFPALFRSIPSPSLNALLIHGAASTKLPRRQDPHPGEPALDPSLPVTAPPQARCRPATPCPQRPVCSSLPTYPRRQ